MRFFICLLDPAGRGIPDDVRRSYESLPRSYGLELQWQSIEHAAVLTGRNGPSGAPMLVSEGDHVAVGTVRLDNPQDLERWSGSGDCGLTDLELVLRTVARHGTRYIPEFLGDFAFIVWSGAARTAVVACDALAVRSVYYTKRGGLFGFASRAEALAIEECYNVQYLAESVAMCTLSPGLTVYANVHAIPAGTMAVLDRDKLVLQRYWSPEAVQAGPTWSGAAHEAAEMCRQLLTEAVRLRLTGSTDVWAQLSGGLDSSSVVSVAQWLAERGIAAQGLAGTVTFVDRQGSAADERHYSNAVVSRWHVRNETIVDPPIWIEDDHAPPRMDQPRQSLAFYPRERRLCTLLRSAGGRVLLTGAGSDELFRGTMFFFADWVARGHVWFALAEMVRWAAKGHVSFWELAYRNLLLPLLPRDLRHTLLRDQGGMLPWVTRAAIRRYGLRARASVAADYAGRIGHKYRDALSTSVTTISRGLEYSVIDDALDVRHPFLYRPLVEFALQLPSELCARPHARKWVLREAMRGILPDAVRTRVGKGAPNEVLAWSLTAQRPLLEPLLGNPILADLGVVDVAKLRAAFDAAPHRPYRGGDLHTNVQATLIIEAWLQMRAGRWPRGGHLSNAYL